MNWKRASGIFLVGGPIIGLSVVFAIAVYSGCEIQDSPFRFLGDDCYKNGIYWNKIAAPLGTLSLFGIIAGPAVWIVLLISERVIKSFKTILERKR